jgi:hypothetical protein
MSFNPSIVLNHALSGLIGGSIVSATAAIVVGGIIGLIAGARSRQIKRTMTPTIIGSFFGTMLIAILPLVSEAQLWGGGYGGILLMFMAFFLIPTGSITGALVGFSYGLKLAQRRNIKTILLIMVISTYSLITVVTYIRFWFHCLRYDWYCSG